MQWVMNGGMKTRHSASGLGSNDEAIEEAGAQVADSIQEIAERANVPEGFVRQLVAAGALPGEEGELGSLGRSGVQGCCGLGRQRGSRSRRSLR
jgi:hypothetical protein